MEPDECLERIKIAVDGRGGRGGDQVNGDMGRIKEETRSMCELVSVIGLPDQPMDVAVTKDLCRFSFPCGIPAPAYDQCSR
ncbi:hypothetical protein B0H19DRAFT_1111757 [Mycena capillaripes]|nr:hypothetical protein B0H19DRAFT_1111757 [Mycena capillaripes]